MTTCKIIFTPTNKEQKNCHALATTSAFNLKLCHKKNLLKTKIFILGTKPSLYELIFYPHIEEGRTQVVCLIKKINLIKIFFLILDLRFLLLQWTSIIAAKS